MYVFIILKRYTILLLGDMNIYSTPLIINIHKYIKKIREKKRDTHPGTDHPVQNRFTSRIG